MIYHVTNDFTKINETSGTVQNTSNIYTLEMGGTSAANSGILIYPLQMHSFTDTNIFIRCVDGNSADVRVVPFELDVKGGDKFDFSLDQLGTTFINDFAFSALAYPNTTDPQLDGKPVLVMAVKDNNDKSQDVKYVFANLESLMILNTSLGGISLTLGNVPTFKICSDNSVEFAADLYPVTDTLIGDTLYFGKHIFQFTGLSSGLTLHESGFYAASDSAYDNSFGSIVAAPNDYSFCFGSSSAFDVDDGDVISVTQLDSNPVNLSLNLDALTTDNPNTTPWKGTDQYGGIYTYTSSTATTHYLKQGSASYTYSSEGITNDTAPSFNLHITRVTNFGGRKNKPENISPVLNNYVKVDEIRDSSTGAITEFVITILGDAALKTGNEVSGNTITTVGTEWTEEVTVDFGNATNPPKYTIKLANDVATNYRGAHNNGKLELVSDKSDTYTFTTDEFIAGFASTQDNKGNTYITKITPLTNRANGDYCTISGLASGLNLHKTANYKYEIYKGDSYDANNVVGTIGGGGTYDGYTITLTKVAALPSNYADTDGFTVKLEDKQAGKYDYVLVLSEADDSEFKNLLNPTGEISERLVRTVEDDTVTFTYTTGKSVDKFVENPREYKIDGDDTYSDSYTFVKGKATVGDERFALTLTNLAVAGDLEVLRDGTLYHGGTNYGKIDFKNKTVTFFPWSPLPLDPNANTKITLGGKNDYVFEPYPLIDIYPYIGGHCVYCGLLSTDDCYRDLGSNSGWRISEDGKSIVWVPSRISVWINVERPANWVVDMNSSNEVFWFPSITQQEYNSLNDEEQLEYKQYHSNDVYYNLNSASAIKVADFDGETIVFNHNVLDNRSLSSPLVASQSRFKLDLATDNETAAISRNFAYETFTAGASAGTYTYAALSSTEGWAVSGDEHQILSVELEGKTFTLNNLRTDLGNLGFDSQGYIHATNGSTIGRMGGTVIKLYDNAVHKLATPILTGADAADFTLILPT